MSSQTVTYVIKELYSHYTPQHSQILLHNTTLTQQLRVVYTIFSNQVSPSLQVRLKILTLQMVAFSTLMTQVPSLLHHQHLLDRLLSKMEVLDTSRKIPYLLQ